MKHIGIGIPGRGDARGHQREHQRDDRHREPLRDSHLPASCGRMPPELGSKCAKSSYECAKGTDPIEVCPLLPAIGDCPRYGAMKASVALGTFSVASSMLFTKASRSARSVAERLPAIVPVAPRLWRAATSSSVCAEPSWKYGPD